MSEGYTDYVRAAAVGKVRDGMSREAVGREMGIPAKTVSNWCMMFGVGEDDEQLPVTSDQSALHLDDLERHMGRPFPTATDRDIRRWRHVPEEPIRIALAIRSMRSPAAACAEQGDG